VFIVSVHFLLIAKKKYSDLCKLCYQKKFLTSGLYCYAYILGIALTEEQWANLKKNISSIDKALAE
jgi:hypothetical protein